MASIRKRLQMFQITVIRFDAALNRRRLAGIGHASCATTLNVYAHVTHEMCRTAAEKINQGIGRAEPQTEIETAP